MLVRVSASFVAGQSADLAPCTPSGLNGDLCQRGNKTEGKRKGKTPGMQAYPAYKCQYTALLQSPEDTKMGRSRQVAGMSTLLLVVSSRARAAPTRTPMLRETDSRHRSTRRDQMLCHRSPRLYIASRRCFVLGQLHHCPCLADMAVLLSDEQTTIRFNQRWRTFSRVRRAVFAVLLLAPEGSQRFPGVLFSLFSLCFLVQSFPPCSFCLDIRTPQ